MKISIIPSDRMIVMDGMAFVIPALSQIDQSIHAIQWDGAKGHIEYVQHEDYYVGNATIDTLAPYQQYIDMAVAYMADPPVDPVIPLTVYLAAMRRNTAFGLAQTADFGVQYSDQGSIGMITTLVTMFDKNMLTGKVNYKGPTGYVSLDKDELLLLGGQVGAHVQKAFNAEKTILEEITMGTVTTHEQVTDRFATLMAA